MFIDGDIGSPKPKRRKLVKPSTGKSDTLKEECVLKDKLTTSVNQKVITSETCLNPNSSKNCELKPNSSKSTPNRIVKDRPTIPRAEKSERFSADTSSILQNPLKKANTLLIGEDVDKTVRKLVNHGESGPTVLLYKELGKTELTHGTIFTRIGGWRDNEFCIALQTPIQRQLLQMFPQIVSIEVLDGLKPNQHNLKLFFVMILDEFREPIPVAWMVSSSADVKFMTSLLKTLKIHCGDLNTKFLMTSKDLDVHRLWCSIFTEKPDLIQNEFEARRDIRTSVHRGFPTIDEDRVKAWKYVESLLNAQEVEKFEELSNGFKDFFKTIPNSESFVKTFHTEWLSRAKEWTVCYRMNAPVNTIFAADAFLRLRKFIGFKGTKYLNQSVDHILKIGYDKCFLRSKRIFKGDQKLSQLLDDIQLRHQKAITTLKYDYVSCSKDDKYKWTVTVPESGSSAISTVYDTQSPCACKMKCKQCEVCLHTYMCSCEDHATRHKMCEHIHLVHSFRLGVPLDDFELIDVSYFESKRSSTSEFEGDRGDTDIFEDGLTNLTMCMTEDGDPGVLSHVKMEEAISIDDVLEAAGLLQENENDVIQGLETDNNLSKNIMSAKTDGDTKKILLDRTTVKSSGNSKQTVLIFTPENLAEKNRNNSSAEAILRFVETDESGTITIVDPEGNAIEGDSIPLILEPGSQ